MSHRSRRPAAASLLALLAALSACEAPPRTPLPPVSGGVCENLAYVFYLVGRNKDQGLSEDEQLAMAREGVTNPFAAQPGRTLRYWRQVIDFVYRSPDDDADAIRAQVLDRCTIDRQGQAVLLWPKEAE